MNCWIISIALAAGVGSSAGVVRAEEGTKSLPKCPVTDEPVNFFVSTETKDGPVYFCCNGCIGKYKAEPAKYAAQVAAQRKELAKLPKVQVTCPVTGEPVDGKTSIESNGEKVSFCCPNCVAQFKEDPNKYRTALANSYTYQTKCPVMGGDIDPRASTTLAGGQKIYFCCPGCASSLFEDPAKFAPKLEAQGYMIRPAQIKPGEKSGHDDAHGQDHDEHDHGDHR